MSNRASTTRKVRDMASESSFSCKTLWLAAVLLLLLTMIQSFRISADLFLHSFVRPIPSQSGVKLGQKTSEYDVLIFQSGHPRAIYLFDLAKGQLRLVTPGVGSELSALPDGQTVAFDLTDHLYAVNVDGTELRQVTDQEGRITSLSWSPDGRLLAYIMSIPSETVNSSLYVLNLETLENKRVSPDGLFVRRYSRISWLLGKYRVLFLARKTWPWVEGDWDGRPADSTPFDLYVVDEDGKDLVNLTNGITNVIDSYLSPDDQTVLFLSDRENRAATEEEGEYMHDFKVFLMDLRNEKVVEVMSLLTAGPEASLEYAGWPWSPDGEWVLLPPRILRPDTLRAVRPDGTLHHEIINVAYGPRGDVGLDGFTASLSPDGRTIAGGGRFKEGDRECLCAVDADGSRFRVLTPNVYVEWLVWSPDGESVFFKYTEEEYSTDYRYGIVNVDSTGFYDPFANLPEKLSSVENAHWLRLSTPTPTPTPTAAVTTPAPTPMATPTPNPAVCTTAGVVILVLASALWLARRSG